MTIDEAIKLKRELREEVYPIMICGQSSISTDNLINAAESKIEKMTRMIELLKEANK